MMVFSEFEIYLLLFIIGLSIWLFVRSLSKIKNSINRVQGELNTKNFGRRLIKVIFNDLLLLKPTWRIRFWTNLFHIIAVWGFILYFPLNIFELIHHIFPIFQIPGLIGNIYRLFIDIFSVFILTAAIFFTVRRFLINKSPFKVRDNVMVLPDAINGIKRDSLIVIILIFCHVGGRLLSESLWLAGNTRDFWQPAASFLSTLWRTGDPEVFLWHLATWVSLLSLFIFIPYFPYSKHIHLFFAPLNHLLKPERKSLSELDMINFEDDSLELFGSLHLEELDKAAIIDSFACIMCFRCQDVCPPYLTGKQLSPAALEINKRYFLNKNFNVFSVENSSTPPLIDFAISEEAVWACTACGACVDICPVGVEPMRDILQIRRGLTLMENSFPKPFQILFRNLERYANPWGLSPNDRTEWTEGLNVPTIEEIPDPDLLWWVGCAGAYDNRAQKTSRAFAQILNLSGIKYAILGSRESCTGDAARRAGKEDVFYELAITNIEILNQINPKKIVTSCPHCLHTLKNEYPSFGGKYNVIHHSQFLEEFRFDQNSQFPEGFSDTSQKLSFHDPCYLSRFNPSGFQVNSLFSTFNDRVSEIPNAGINTFCCGGGGSQMWKEEEFGNTAINEARLNQLLKESPDCLITACPFCKTKMEDAVTQSGQALIVEDLAEYYLKKITKESL